MDSFTLRRCVICLGFYYTHAMAIEKGKMMLSLKGTYQNGQLQLEQPVTTNKPVQTIVLEEIETDENTVMSHFQASLERNYCLGELLAK